MYILAIILSEREGDVLSLTWLLREKKFTFTVGFPNHLCNKLHYLTYIHMQCMTSKYKTKTLHYIMTTHSIMDMLSNKVAATLRGVTLFLCHVRRGNCKFKSSELSD